MAGEVDCFAHFGSIPHLVRDRKFVGGSFYRISDKSGFKVRAEDTEKEWNGLWVRKVAEFEERQPQDFVRGVADDQRVPEPRPRQLDAFLGPLITTLTAAAAAGATSLAVASSVRMFAGDVIEIMVGSFQGSVQFRTTLSSVPTTTSIAIPAPGLPQAALSGAEVTNITASATVTAASLGAIP